MQLVSRPVVLAYRFQSRWNQEYILSEAALLLSQQTDQIVILARDMNDQVDRQSSNQTHLADYFDLHSSRSEKEKTIFCYLL